MPEKPMKLRMVLLSIGTIVIMVVVAVLFFIPTNERKDRGVRSLIVAEMRLPIEAFRADVGRYPTTGEGLSVLVSNERSLSGWRGPYLKTVPLDPWGRALGYVSPGKRRPDSYDLFSFGADGVESPDDIGNW